MSTKSKAVTVARKTARAIKRDYHITLHWHGPYPCDSPNCK